MGNNNSIMYVTTFNAPLFKGLGRNLISSFTGKKCSGMLCCFYEGFENDRFSKGRVVGCDLNNNSILKDWLKQNEDIIPMAFGGKVKKCNCKNKHNKNVPMAKRHVEGCCYGWNYRASKWFRKILSLRFALELGHDYIIWLDCDCEFIGRLSGSLVKSIFKDNDFIYHWGEFRKSNNLPIETGLMGFQGDGFKLIENVYNEFMDGSFRSRTYWDDSHMFTYLLDSVDCKKLDLVGHLNKSRFGVSTHVVPRGPFSRYIQHHKGITHRMGIDKQS